MFGMPGVISPSSCSGSGWTMQSPLSFTLSLLPLPLHLILLSSLGPMRPWNRWLENLKWHRRDGNQTLLCAKEKQSKIPSCISVLMRGSWRKKRGQPPKQLRQTKYISLPSGGITFNFCRTHGCLCLNFLPEFFFSFSMFPSLPRLLPEHT